MQEQLALVKAAPTDQQHLLFHNYVERTLQRKGTRIHAPAQQTKHWLAWLARQLTAHQQSEVYLEQFQPDWLPKRQRAFYRWNVGLIFGLVGGLIFGLIGGLNTKIESAEALTWSSKRLSFVLIFGLAGGLFCALFLGLIGVLIGVLLFGLIGLLSVGPLLGFSRKQLTEHSMLSPNEGIHRSLKNGLLLFAY